ncbi:MAG TPA: FUSC family membrane protein [Flavisolibacter sp.]|nr:FUSC family membrane protein [Flavisolibacter sp.]
MELTEQLVTKNVKEVRYFFYSQAFADGFRASFAILFPALLGSYLGHFEIGLTIALGAMCVSLTDAPGPLLHKRNGMLFCAGFAFLVAVITAFARMNVYTMGLEIALVTFFFSMFVVYGARATGVGNAAILIMILSMDREIEKGGVLLHAGYIFAGGLFYLAISLLLYKIRPYRHAQRVLGDCIREIANYLSTKADFYNIKTDLEENYKRMVAQQVVVNEKQDLVREVFFKTRQIVEESTDESRKLVFTFVETVDLFEDITAAYYDYRSLQNLFGKTGALKIVHRSLEKIVGEINAVGIAIQSNTSFRKGFDYDSEVKALKAEIDAIPTDNPGQKLVLRKIIVNIRNLLADLQNIEQYFETGVNRKKTSLDHSHFVSHQPLDPKIFWTNLNLKSVAFRHAIRVSLACVIGFLVTKIFPYGAHSYWILLTIAFIIKPAFSLTKQRNIERIIGTVAGGLVGVAILLLVQNTTALFIIMVVFMIGTYSFMRINYLAMVMSVTPYVLILFSFLGTEFRMVATERIIDTLIGCAIAFSASYFLFPNWESEQLKSFMQDIVRANASYLEKVIRAMSGGKVEELEYKLARKEVYLHSANLSAAFQRMLSEPKNKQGSRSQVQQFVVLNHILFSNIATIAKSISRDKGIYPGELIHLAKKTYGKLEAGSKRLGSEEALPKLPDTISSNGISTTDDVLMKEQLDFIYNVSKDIDKLATSLVEKPLNG